MGNKTDNIEQYLALEGVSAAVAASCLTVTAKSGVSAVADGELLVEDEVPSKELV